MATVVMATSTLVYMAAAETPIINSKQFTTLVTLCLSVRDQTAEVTAARATHAPHTTRIPIIMNAMIAITMIAMNIMTAITMTAMHHLRPISNNSIIREQEVVISILTFQLLSTAAKLSHISTRARRLSRRRRKPPSMSQLI